MDARTLIKAMVASMAVFFLWMALSQFLGWGSKPQAPPAQPQTQPGQTPATATTQPTQTSRPAVASTAPSAPRVVTVEVDATETVTLGSDVKDGPYELLIEVTNQGAGIQSIYLANHRFHVDNGERYPLVGAIRDPNTGREFAAWATERVHIDGQGEPVSLADVRWTLDGPVTEDADGLQSVTLSTVLQHDGGDLLKVLKTYALHPTAAGENKNDAARRFDVTITLAVENLSDQNRTVTITQRGPAGLPKEDPRQDLRGAVGARERNGVIAIEETATQANVLPTEPQLLTSDSDDGAFAWGAVYNKYFTCIAAPVRSSDAAQPNIAACQAVKLIPDNLNEADNDLAIRLVTAPIALAPGENKSLTFQAYFGPKSDRVFENEVYRDYQYAQLVAHAGWTCTFQFLTRFMISLLHFFESFTRNYGLAIIILVLLVRALLHPITKKGQVGMMKMQKSMSALQPKVEDLKTRFANDRQKLNTEIMKLYREEGVNPAGNILSCLPMFLQFPIWVALWTALSSTIEMRHAPLLVEGYWIKDLAGPDALISFSKGYHVPLLSLLTGEIRGLNILPILLGISMYLQQRFMAKLSQPAPGTKVSDQIAQQQQMQQKMFSFMSVFFTFILYNAPSGLNLYIMASTLFGLFEQQHIRKHIKEQEAQGTLLAKKPATPRKAPTWLERLQKKAEEAQRIESAKKVEKKKKLRNST